MRKDLMFYFYGGSDQEDVLNRLIELKESGNFHGFTFPARNYHICFDDEQKKKTRALLNTYSDIKFEDMEFFDGHHDFSFKMGKNRTAFIHFCPRPLFSEKALALLDNDMSIGLTTKYNLLITNELRDTILDQISGINLNTENVVAGYDLFSITNRFNISIEEKESEGSIDLSNAELLDLFILSNDAIICSHRFARLIAKFWDGRLNVIMQPLQLKGVDRKNIAKFTKAIKIDVNKKQIEFELMEIERHFNISMPSSYKNLVIKTVKLPDGWLNYKDGRSSEIVKITSEERLNAEPALPQHLIVLYSYGNGDYACVDQNQGGDKLVVWRHEDGSIGETVDVSELLR